MDVCPESSLHSQLIHSPDMGHIECKLPPPKFLLSIFPLFWLGTKLQL